MSALDHVDPAIAAVLKREENRQRTHIELIASENYVSAAVREAQASVLTNKYAEGYPGKRYYGGCEFADQAEQLAIDRAKELFGAEYANVQPHSGAQANMAVYFSFLDPGDTVLGLRLDQGGHLTHGDPVNFSGKLFNFVSYGLEKDTERIDMAEVERLAKENRPKIIVTGASAYSRFIDFARFREIADDVGALFMVDMAHPAGLIAGGAHPSPVPHAHIVTSTTHKTLRGPRGGFVLSREEFGPKIDKTVFPWMQGGPLMHTIAAKAVGFAEALRPDFKDYARRVVENAAVLSSELSRQGIRVVSGGTDNHLMLVDLGAGGISGKKAEGVLDKVGITANKNAVPFDSRSKFVTSGLRLGSPAVTSRGFGPSEMRQIAGWIVRVVNHPEDEAVASEVSDEVAQLCGRFGVPGLDDRIEVATSVS